MIRSAWHVGWWDVTVTGLLVGGCSAWFALTSPRARSNRAKLRARRRHDRAIRSIRG